MGSGLCTQCGAPLPSDPRATCAYCGVTTGDAPVISAADLAARSLRVIEALKGSAANGADPEQALVTAAREHLGPLGETGTVARVVAGLARSFDAANRTQVQR